MTQRSAVSFCLAATAVGVVVAYAFAAGFGTQALVGVLLVTVCSALAFAALMDFERFVIGMLLVRSGIDWLRYAMPGSGIGASGGPATIIGALFVLAAVLWLAVQKRAGTLRAFDLASRAMAVFLLAGGISVAGARFLVPSFSEFSRIVGAGLMFVVLRQLFATSAHAALLVKAVLASAVVPLAVGLWEMVSTPEVFTGTERLSSTFIHPNGYGYYLALILTLGLAVTPHLERRARLGMGVALSLGALQLALTYSRGSWIAMAVAIVVIGVFQSWRFLAVSTIVVAVIMVALPSVVARTSDLGEQRSIAGTPGNSFAWRVQYWGDAIELANVNPLTGVGLRMAQESLPQDKPIHNDYVRTYVETGLFGLVAYVGLFGALALTSWRSLRSARAGMEKGIAVAAAAALAGFVVASGAMNLISQVVILWYLFALLAASAAVTRGTLDRPVADLTVGA